MTRARQPKPTAPPLATTLRAAIASDWRTLAALDTLAGARGSDARRLVHEALREIKAGGAVLEERVGRGGVEVRLVPIADPGPIPGVRYGLSPEQIAEMGGPEGVEAIFAETGEEPMDLDALQARAEAHLEAAEPAPPVGHAAPVEAAGAPSPPQPGPSSRCAVCGERYHGHGGEEQKGHPFTPKPRGRPRGPIVAVDGGRAERSRADVLDAQPDPYRVEVDPALATEASMRAEAERQKAATHDARVEAIEGVAAALARAAAEPETSRGEAPGEQDHATCDTDDARPDGSSRVPALRVAAERAPGKPRVPRPRAHPVAPSDGVDQSASRVGAKDVATAGDVARPCRPPLCHADDIHEPARVRGFARALCETHRRWVEGAGGTVAPICDIVALAH